MEDKQLDDLLRFFTRLNKKGKKAVIRKARDLLDQQNKNASRGREAGIRREGGTSETPKGILP